MDACSAQPTCVRNEYVSLFVTYIVGLMLKWFDKFVYKLAGAPQTMFWRNALIEYICDKEYTAETILTYDSHTYADI